MHLDPIQIPDCVILARLSSGGMGEVLLAQKKSSHGFEKLLAIKTIRADLARRPDIRAMFLDEARLVARLDHPAITQVYDFGEEDGVLYLSMEYVAGVPLNKLILKQRGPIPPLVATQIAAQAARGLHAAHELTDLKGHNLGVVHRDVSPANLILTFDGRVKILDFGIAFMHERESPDTIQGEVKGKPSYISPEQVRGEKVDRKADVYSLSIVLHEMLTGRKLFTKGNMLASAMAKERANTPNPSSLVGPLPRGLEAVVMRGLAPRLSDRLRDAKAMAEALEDIARHHDAPPLETFVEAQLGLERETHRAWLQAVLSGEYSASGNYENFGNFKASTSRPSISGADVTRNDKRPGNERSLLFGGTQADETATVRPQQTSRVLLLVPLFLAAGLGVWLGLIFWPDAMEPLPAEPSVEKPIGGIVDIPTEPIPAEPPIVDTPSEPPPPVAAAPTETPGEDENATEDDTPPVEAVLKPTRIKVSPPSRRPNKTTPRKSRKKSKNRSERAVGHGYLTIGAVPYAMVRIDGAEVGVTPIVRKRMPVGRYKVQLVGPDTGTVRLERTVTISKEAHARITIP